MDTKELNGRLSTTFNFIAITAVAAIVGAGLAIAVNILCSGNSEPYLPLGNYTDPQIVVNTEPVSLSRGDVVLVAATKCNISDRDVSVRGEMLGWRRVPNNEGETVISPNPSMVGTKEFPAGACIDSLFENFPPPGVVPGIWQIEGQDKAGDQTITWRTEPFEVVP